VNLVLAGRPVLVVGGGRVALRKVEGLLAAGARVHVVAPDLDPRLKELPLTWEERPYRTGEVAGYRLVVSATADRAVNAQVFADAEKVGVWVNSADDPGACSVTLPAVLRRGPVTVAVSTGGASPALASWLRDRLGDELGPEYEVLADLLAAQRSSVRSAGVSTEDVDWRRALDSDILDLIRAGRVEEARERLEQCLSSS
jgi:siroheme synthase-like protein